MYAIKGMGIKAMAPMLTSDTAMVKLITGRIAQRPIQREVRGPARA